MLKPYLLIRVGYEGIEGIIYFSYFKKRIVKKYHKAIKKAIQDNKDLNDELRKDHPDWNESMFHYEDEKSIIERFCIEQWDGKRFKCQCSKCGITLEEAVFY